jgi:Flp pilus assembly protein protease CpaA
MELIALGIALAGSSLAAAWDLKTTEIPDSIPHGMAVVALCLAMLKSWLTGNIQPFLNSLASGLGLLSLGFCMYWTGQWGGGDAKLLAAIGFFGPTLPARSTIFPFALSFLLNVFLLGAAYILLYAFLVAVLNPSIIKGFLRDVKASSKPLGMGSLSLFLLFLVLNSYLLRTADLLSLLRLSFFPLALTLGLYLVWRFARIVEEVGFRKRVHVSKLRVGDVLLESRRWDGLSEEELKELKRTREFVVIKEGVRFGLVFPLALLFTAYMGDAILFILGI